MGAIPTSAYFAEMAKDGYNKGGLWWAGMRPEGANGELRDALILDDIVGAPKTSLETLRLAKLDWEVGKEPVFRHGTPTPVYQKVRVENEHGEVLYSSGDFEQRWAATPPDLRRTYSSTVGNDQKMQPVTMYELPIDDAWTEPFMEVPKYRAIVRKDTGMVMGMVTEDFEPVQNREGFEIADLLAGEGEILYEGALALWDGAFVCMLARRPEPMRILGDDFTNYFLFYNWHNGAGSVGGCYTDVRVVCQNTYQAAVDSAERQFKLRHTSNVVERLKMKAQILLQNERYTSKVTREAEELVAIKMPEHKWEAVVHSLVPMPLDASVQTIKNREMQRFGLEQTIMMPDLENFRWTGWGAVQAVSAFVNHAQPLRKQKSWAQNRFHNNWVKGNDLLNQAIHLVKALD